MHRTKQPNVLGGVVIAPVTASQHIVKLSSV